MGKPTLSNEAYMKRKEKILAEDNLIRKEIDLADFTVDAEGAINIGGNQMVPLSKRGFKRLLQRLRIPTSFAERFEEGFGPKALQELVNMIKTQFISEKGGKIVTLLANPVTREVIDILPEGRAAISTAGFLGFSENIIDRFGLGVIHFGNDGQGGTTLNTVHQNSIFNIPGYKNEMYRMGVTFRNNPSRGLEVMPFMERLICTNGIYSHRFSDTIALNSLTDESINKFNNHILNLSAVGFRPSGMVYNIRKAKEVNASLAELEKAASIIMDSERGIEWDLVQRYVPVDRAMQAYRDAGAQPEDFTRKQKANANGGIKVFDLVNAVTNFASNAKGIDDFTRTEVMGKAGEMFLNKYDMAEAAPINPFATTPLVGETALARMRGEN